MRRDLPALARERFDVLIVGGGILGAGIARDAALRGLRVALVDRADFAAGTSSASSKLIHGGFRYLEQYAFRLVAESCRERRILQHIAPHRVRALSFLLPVYEGDPRPLLKMRLGMTLYDLLSLYGNTAPHRYLTPAKAAAEEPALDRRGLRGAIRFFDCQEDDARFTVDNIRHAADCGAVVANYCEVVGFSGPAGRGEGHEGKILAARVIDRDPGRAPGSAGDSFEVAARVFINAAGPWVARVAGLLRPAAGQPPPQPLALSPTKGVHVLLPRLTLGRRGHGLFFQARRDGRMMFILPWHDCTLVGTTDTDYRGDPSDARPEPADIDYLLAECRALLPHSPTTADLTPAAVLTAFAGVRPLLASDQSDPSSRSREERLLIRDNLLSVAGGKYTTYRAIAENATNQVFRLLGRRPPPCRTATTPIPDYRPRPFGERLADVPAVYEGDVIEACREEMALTLEDVTRRRIGLALSRHGGPETARRVARIMAGSGTVGRTG